MDGQRLPAILGGAPSEKTTLPIVRPCFPALHEIAGDVDSAMRSGCVTNHGPQVREFEREIGVFLEVPHVAVVSSGTSAIMLLLRALGVEGGEVIVPAFTFSATPHAVAWCGAKPVFADVDPRTGGLHPADVERRITPRTSAILGVDVYGIPCSHDDLVAVGDHHRIPVVFDSAPAFGAGLGGRRTGSSGSGQAFSFHATKVLAAVEGGCVTSKDPAVVERVATLRNFGQVRGADCDEPGLNAKMSELHAVIGRRQLSAVPVAVSTRAARARQYRTCLDGVPGMATLDGDPHVSPSWLYFPIIIDPDRFGIDRGQLATALAAENIEARTYYSPACHRLAAYRETRRLDIPVAEHLADNVIALPLYNDMTSEECERVTMAILRIHRYASQVRGALPPDDRARATAGHGPHRETMREGLVARRRLAP